MTKRARTIGEVRIEIADDCVGSAQCVAVAPDVFELGEDGLGSLTDGVLGDDALARAREAELICPTAAITVSGAR